MKIRFRKKADKDLIFFQKSGNKAILNKIELLLKDITKNPFSGIGKPEALKHKLSGLWSRHITSEHRIIYEVDNNKINVYSLKGHYEKK